MTHRWVRYDVPPHGQLVLTISQTGQERLLRYESKKKDRGWHTAEGERVWMGPLLWREATDDETT